MKPKFVHNISLLDALDTMINFADGNLNGLKHAYKNEKVRKIANRLVQEGYNPYELLLYFANKHVGKGGWAKIKNINHWTSDTVWIAFLEYKHKMQFEIPLSYTIQMSGINTRLNYSTKLEILETNVVAIAGLVVKLDLAVKWQTDGPGIEKYMSKHWDLGMLNLLALPEYLPHTHAITQWLIQEGSVKYV